MKKILAFLLAAMMVLAFAACGEDNGGTPTYPRCKGYVCRCPAPQRYDPLRRDPC